MTEEKYNTKDIRHIDEKSQEYIAEYNRTTEELHTYYCKDCFKKQEQIDRLEQENDALKSQLDFEVQSKEVIDELEQENKELKSDLKQYDVWLREERQDNAELATDNFKLRTALEEIRNLCNKGAGVYTNAKVVGLINEVLK